jgi:hypothetical protein
MAKRKEQRLREILERERKEIHLEIGDVCWFFELF